MGGLCSGAWVWAGCLGRVGAGAQERFLCRGGLPGLRWGAWVLGGCLGIGCVKGGAWGCAWVAGEGSVRLRLGCRGGVEDTS